MKTTSYLSIICLDTRWVKIKDSPDVMMIVAIDVHTTRAIAVETLQVDSSRTWAAFIRSRVLSDPGFKNRKAPSLFYLNTEPESVPLISADLGPPHTYRPDDGRCEKVCREFFEGFEKRMK
ncbi:MAG: hypothetical protein IT233_01455 [Bacteroidia bacterium]|nr:hypothetical protein [Bacteroidia bacterium]